MISIWFLLPCQSHKAFFSSKNIKINPKCVSMYICKWEKGAVHKEGNETFILHVPLPQITVNME